MWKNFILDIAETFDAWRVVPRIGLLAYGFLVYQLYTWFSSIQTFVKTSCDAKVLETLLSAGIPLTEAQEIACTVIDIVGGPTGAQTTFVTTIVGLSAAVFGLYTNTGRKWDVSRRHTNNDTRTDENGVKFK